MGCGLSPNGAGRSRLRMSLSATDMDFVRKLVLERAGIVVGEDKEYLVVSRLEPLARAEGLESLEALVACLRNQHTGTLIYKVIEAMTTNETSFFRDVHPFEALKSDILPALLKRNASTQKLDVWCAASSTGQEPYCIAMLLRDNFPQIQSWTVNMLATDISEAVLSKARLGLYSSLEVNRGLPAPLLVKHFTRNGSNFELKKDIRDMVEFREMNLTQAWPTLPAMDIIFVRNVLIYFNLEAKREILCKIRKTLKPQGYLFLGGAETTINIDDNYQRLQVGKTVCYQVASD